MLLSEFKYELVPEMTKKMGNITLYRIRALKDFGNVKTGDLGGWVQGYFNLYHAGLCWVADEAMVWGKARIHKNALIRGRARIFGKATITGETIIGGFVRVSSRCFIYNGGHYEGRQIFKTKKDYTIL